MTSRWWTIVYFGGWQGRRPPRGAYRSPGEARAALSRYVDACGEAVNVTDARVVGPFRSRRLAERADISNYSALKGD